MLNNSPDYSDSLGRPTLDVATSEWRAAAAQGHASGGVGNLRLQGGGWSGLLSLLPIT